jgi:hypothetical protein
MDGQFVGKRVPWSQLEEYLAVHKKTIVAYLGLLETETMDKATIETNLPKSFWKLQETIAKIIKDNNISPKQEESKGDELHFIVKTVMKLQSSLISQNTSNQDEIKKLINSMKREIEKTFGS